VLVPKAGHHLAGTLEAGARGGNVMHFHGWGPPGNIEPFDPITLPVVIVNG
jgi:hypothetical protein